MLSSKNIDIAYYKTNNLPTMYKYIFREKIYNKNHYNNFVSIMTYLYKRFRTKSEYNSVYIYLKPNYYSKNFINNHELGNTKNIGNWKKIVKCENITYRNTISILNRLKELNIINIKKGFKKFKKIGFKKYVEDVSEITKIKLIEPDKWFINNFIKENDDLFLFYGELYNIKTSLKYNNIKKYSAIYNNKKINLKIPTEKYIRNNVDYLNNNLHYETGYNIFNYQKVFGKNKNEYGRYYGLFQRIPKKVREKILNHHNFIELDYDNFIFNCFYLRETGKTYEGDVYNNIIKNIEALKNNPEYYKYFRKLIKQVSIIVVNSKNKHKAIQSINNILRLNDLYKNNFETNRNNITYYKNNNIPNNVPIIKFNADEIINAMSIAHSKINKYFFKSNSSWTQNVESNIMKKLLTYCINNNIKAFSIHDAIIIPESKKNEIKSLMNHFFYKLLLINTNIKNNKHYINNYIIYINSYYNLINYINLNNLILILLINKLILINQTYLIRYRLTFIRERMLEGY